jgi:hypothetical protein
MYSDSKEKSNKSQDEISTKAIFMVRLDLCGFVKVDTVWF